MNQLTLDQSPANFGGGRTFWNRVEGQPLFSVDPNAKNWDPTRVLTLNPAAWTDAAPGEYGTSAPYYNNFRWQRQPSESMSIGRVFVMHRERGVNLSVRAEWQNIFNRLFLANPMPVLAGGFAALPPNPATPTVRNTQGALSQGFGFINTFNGGAAQPRSGQIVVRLSF